MGVTLAAARSLVRLLRPTMTSLVKIREVMRIKVTRGTQNMSKVE
jgi:hypothetical protein